MGSTRVSDAYSKCCTVRFPGRQKRPGRSRALHVELAGSETAGATQDFNTRYSLP